MFTLNVIYFAFRAYFGITFFNIYGLNSIVMSDAFENKFLDLLKENMNEIKESLNKLVESQERQDKNMMGMQSQITELYRLRKTCAINEIEKEVRELSKETIIGRYIFKTAEIMIKNPKQTAVIFLIIFGMFVAKDGISIYDSVKKLFGL